MCGTIGDQPHRKARLGGFSRSRLSQSRRPARVHEPVHGRHLLRALHTRRANCSTAVARTRLRRARAGRRRRRCAAVRCAQLDALRAELGRLAARSLPQGWRQLPPAPALLLPSSTRATSSRRRIARTGSREEYNALHGGMRRWFEPITPDVVSQPAWTRLLQALGESVRRVEGACGRWYVEAHQFRIDTSDGIGRPTPEGAHRDGVDFVAVLLVARQASRAAKRAYSTPAGPDGQRFTLLEPWTLLLLDDARVIHESTPIQPLGRHGYRDTLVLTYRARQFPRRQLALYCARPGNLTLAGRRIMSERNATETKARFHKSRGLSSTTVFAAIASSCQTQAEGFLGLAVMVSILAHFAGRIFIYEWCASPFEPQLIRRTMPDGSDARMRGYPLPSLIVVVLALLIGFGAIR